MARLLALEYDQFEARVVVARTSGGSAIFEQAFSVDLAPRDGAAGAPPVGERLAAALSAHGVSSKQSLVAVGRTSIELRVLSVPPAPDDELPEMVRFQATQSFTSLGEDWPLDFVKLRSQGDEGQAILAAAIAPELVAQITSAFKTAGTQPSRLVLRPFAAASLLKRRYDDSRCRLMVDLLAGEADLTVLEEGEVVFLRTVRIPQSEAGFGRAVLSEIRRTMLAAQNQLNGRAVEHVVLCGDSEDHDAIRQQLDEALPIDVELFDPFSSVQLGGELTSKLPEHHGRFAPLLGMLLDEAESKQHDIDFLNPRKKVEEKKPWLRYGLLAGAVAATILAGVFLGWSIHSRRAGEIADLKAARENLLDTSKLLEERVAKVKQIDQWNQSNINWLDELSDVSQKFPPSEEAMATVMTAGTIREGGGVMWIEGVAREYDVIGQIELAVDDDRHEVAGSGGSPHNRIEGYSVEFKEKITVSPRTVEEMAADAEEKKPATAEEPADEKPAADATADNN